MATKVTTEPTKTFYAGGVQSAASQKMLKRIAKATKDKPLRASTLKGQYPNRIARMLAALGYAKQEKREDLGIVFVPNAKTQTAIV